MNNEDVRVKNLNDNGFETHSISISGQRGVMSSFHSTVSTHTEYTGYRYYRNRGNAHTVNAGNDQSINYFAKTCIKILNNSFKRQNSFAFFNGDVEVIFQKMDKKYFINGNMVTKSRLNSVVPSIVMRLGISKDGGKFSKFIDNIVDTDPIITAAIVNKIEYNFYDEGVKVTTLLNIEKTGKENSAIELYEGVWVQFKDTQMKSFINSCKGNKNKFLGISPEELYYTSRNELLTPLEIKTVYAFLLQNRKSGLVEKRSMELFKDLTERFKGRILEKAMTIEDSKVDAQCMAVSGKQLDWLVVDRGYKHGRQDVSTYLVLCGSNYTLTGESNREIYEPKDSNEGLSNLSANSIWYEKANKSYYVLLGPICIDQAHTGISIGDQFAARAMALLNDVHSFNQVSTLRGYSKVKVKNRVDWNAVSTLYRKK